MSNCPTRLRRPSICPRRSSPTGRAPGHQQPDRDGHYALRYSHRSGRRGDGRSQNPDRRHSGLAVGFTRKPPYRQSSRRENRPVDRRCRCEGFMKGNRLTRISGGSFVLCCGSVVGGRCAVALVYYRLDPAILWASERFPSPDPCSAAAWWVSWPATGSAIK